MVNATAVFRTFKYVRAQDVHLAEASSDDSHIQSLSREQALTEEMSPLLESSIDPPRGRLIILPHVNLNLVGFPIFSSKCLLRHNT